MKRDWFAGVIIPVVIGIILGIIALLAIVLQVNEPDLVTHAKSYGPAIRATPLWLLSFLMSPIVLACSCLLIGSFARGLWSAWRADRPVRQTAAEQLGDRAYLMAYQTDTHHLIPAVDVELQILLRDLYKMGFKKQFDSNQSIDLAKVSAYLYFIAALLKRNEIEEAKAVIAR